MLFLSSPPQRALCVIGRLGREKKTMHAAGMMGRGKGRTFPSSSALTFLVIFLMFLGIAAGHPRRRAILMYRAALLCHFLMML